MGRAGMKAHFEALAADNARTNRRLYAAAAALPAAMRGDLAPGSALRGLSAGYVTDVLWMTRLRGEASPPWTTDHVPHPFLGDLTARRRALDLDIRGFVGALTGDQLSAPLRYLPPGQTARLTSPLTEALTGFFNHASCHQRRGGDILTRLTDAAQAPDAPPPRKGP